MVGYLAQRLATGFVTLFGVALIVFLVMRVIPGDAAVMMSGAGSGVVSQEELQQVRHQLGIDRPLVVQFADWATHVGKLDFGTSLRTGSPVIEDISRRFPYTLEIVVLSMIIAVGLGVPAGVLSAWLAGTWVDRILQTITIVGLAAPSFWIGLLFILGLVFFFHWSAPLFWQPIWMDPLASLSQLIWPSLAVGLRQLALIRTARAKGLSERRVVFRHALWNGALPIITLIGFEIAALFGSLIITESVFSVPGLGQYVVQSILDRDYPAAQGIILILAAIVVLGNLAVDMLYGLLDPRTRVQGARA